MQTIKCPHCGNDFVTTYKTCPFCGTPAPALPVNRKGGKRLAGKSTKAPRQPVSSAPPELSEEWQEELFRVPDVSPDEVPPSEQPRQAAASPAAPKQTQPQPGGDDAQPAQVQTPAPPVQPQEPASQAQDSVPARPKEQSGRSGRSFWRYFFFVLSLLLIAAAVFIVINIITTLFGQKGSPAPAPSAEVSDMGPGISFAQPNVHLAEVGSTAQLSVASHPATLELGTISWQSSDPDVVTVDETGLATAVSEGSAEITAQSGAYLASCIVTVGEAEAPEPGTSASPSDSPLTLSREDFTLPAPGTSYQLTVTGAAGDVTWSVKDTSVATVSDTGMVVAVSKGTTTITAEANGQTATCIVRVR